MSKKDDRIAELEAEVERLSADLAWYRAHPLRLPPHDHGVPPYWQQPWVTWTGSGTTMPCATDTKIRVYS